VGESTVPPTTIFALARKPLSALVTGGSHAMPPDAKGSSSARARASLPATCSAYGCPMRVHERHVPASK